MAETAISIPVIHICQHVAPVLTAFLRFHDHFACSLPICDLVVRVPGYIMEIYCVSCEVRTEFIYAM
jgi:hypothetical protein